MVCVWFLVFSPIFWSPVCLGVVFQGNPWHVRSPPQKISFFVGSSNNPKTFFRRKTGPDSWKQTKTRGFSMGFSYFYWKKKQILLALRQNLRPIAIWDAVSGRDVVKMTLPMYLWPSGIFVSDFGWNKEMKLKKQHIFWWVFVGFTFCSCFLNGLLQLSFLFWVLFRFYRDPKRLDGSLVKTHFFRSLHGLRNPGFFRASEYMRYFFRYLRQYSLFFFFIRSKGFEQISFEAARARKSKTIW